MAAATAGTGKIDLPSPPRQWLEHQLAAWALPYRTRQEGPLARQARRDLLVAGDQQLILSTVELSMRTGAERRGATDGALLQALADAPAASTDLVSGDPDSDGRDEFLYGNRSEVVCLEVPTEPPHRPAFSTFHGTWAATEGEELRARVAATEQVDPRDWQ